MKPLKLINRISGMILAASLTLRAIATDVPSTPPAPQTSAETAVPALAQIGAISKTPEAEANPDSTNFTREWRHDEDGRERDAVAVGQKGTLGSDESCDHFVVVLGTADCKGHVERDAVIVASDAEINGTIEGDLVLIMSKAHIGSNTVVKGQMVVVGPAPDIEAGARISRHGTEFSTPPFLGAADYITKGLLWGRPFPPGVRWVWWVALAMFSISFLITLLFPRPVSNCVKVLRARPFACFFAGIGFRILFPLLVILAACTVILIPVIPFLFCIVIAGGFLGKAALCVALGQLLVPHDEDSNGLTLLVGFVIGAVLIYCLYMIPFLGMFVYLIVWPAILGAAMLSRFGVPRAKRLTPPTPSPQTPPAPGSPSAASSPTPASPDSGWSAPTGSAGIPAGVSATGSAHPADAQAMLQVALPETGGSATPPPPTEPPIPTSPPPSYATMGAAPAAGATIPPLMAPPASDQLSSADILACPRAGFFWRLAAIALDLVIVLAALNFLVRTDSFENGGRHRGFLIVWLAYHVGMWMWKGTTLGGSVFGLKCVRTSGAPLDWRVALMRAFASCLSFLALGLGFFWIVWDSEKQSWHDKIADTMVVKMPRAISLV